MQCRHLGSSDIPVPSMRYLHGAVPQHVSCLHVGAQIQQQRHALVHVVVVLGYCVLPTHAGTNQHTAASSATLEHAVVF